MRIDRDVGMTPKAEIEHFEFRNASGPAGYQAFSVDWRAGLIRGIGEGFWTMEQASTHIQTWKECVRAIQNMQMPVRVIADLRKSQTQSQKVASFVRDALMHVYLPRDRMAVVVESSLAKMQFRRIVSGEGYGYFVSYDAAETWIAAFAAGRGFG
jgi:hypothetical protein